MRRGSREALCSPVDAVPGDGAGARGHRRPTGLSGRGLAARRWEAAQSCAGPRAARHRHVALCRRSGREDSACFQQALGLKLLQVCFAGFLVLTFYLVQRDSLEI